MPCSRTSRHGTRGLGRSRSRIPSTACACSGTLWRMDHATAPRHLSTAALAAGLAEVGRSPRDVGTLDLVVRRPAVNERELLTTGALDVTDGLVGDGWAVRPGGASGDVPAHPGRQL